jgi:hypothetical protein
LDADGGFGLIIFVVLSYFVSAQRIGADPRRPLAGLLESADRPAAADGSSPC